MFSYLSDYSKLSVRLLLLFLNFSTLECIRFFSRINKYLACYITHVTPSREDFVDRPLDDLEHLSYYSVMVQEMVLSCFFFPYLELYYYSHWPYKMIYLVNHFKSSSHHFIRGIVTHLVMQEKLSCKIGRIQVI